MSARGAPHDDIPYDDRQVSQKLPLGETVSALPMCDAYGTDH